MSEQSLASVHLGAARRRVAKAHATADFSEKMHNMALAIEHYDALDKDLCNGGELPEPWDGAKHVLHGRTIAAQ